MNYVLMIYLINGAIIFIPIFMSKYDFTRDTFLKRLCPVVAMIFSLILNIFKDLHIFDPLINSSMFFILLFLGDVIQVSKKQSKNKIQLGFPLMAFYSQIFIIIVINVYQYLQIDIFYSFVTIAIYAVIVLIIDFI